MDKSKLQLAVAISIISCPFGALICGLGHLLVFMALETGFAPPLQAQENFGQFGFFTIYVGIFGAIYGLSLGLIPYSRFVGWVPAFLLISCVAGYAEPIDFMTTAGFAMFIVAFAVFLSAFAVSFAAKSICRRSIQ